MAAELTLTRSTMEAVSGFGLPSWLTLPLQKIRRALLSQEEQRLLHLVEFGASAFGAPLLAAESLDDLDDCIDAAIERPELQMLSSLMIASVSEGLLERSGSSLEVAPQATQIFGGAGQDLLYQGFRLAAITSAGLACLHRSLGAPFLQRAVDELRSSATPLDFLNDPQMPAEVGLALLGGIKAGVCTFAMAQAVLTEARTPPWLGLAIAERWVEGQRSHLRLLAAIPEACVPADVVPPEERLDLARIAHDAEKAEARFRELEQSAREGGTAVYPPHAEPDDD